MADTSSQSFVGVDVGTDGKTVVVRARYVDGVLWVDDVEEHTPLPTAKTPPAKPRPAP
jgi:hypothetical protein